MNEPSGFHSIFQGFPRQVWQIPPYNSQAPCTVSSTLSFFSFLPVRLEGQGILLSVSHLGEWRNWQEGSTLTRVKVRTRWGHKSMTQLAGSRIMSSQRNAHSLTPTAQFPLQKGAGQTCLSGLRQSLRAKMHLKALLIEKVLFIYSTSTIWVHTVFVCTKPC